MKLINLLSAIDITSVQPDKTFPPWEWMLSSALKKITSYSLRVIVATLIIKLILFLPDFYSRLRTRKNDLITRRLAPQLEKIRASCGDDKMMAMQIQMKLQKKEGYSMRFFLLYMILTLLVFITFFSAMRNISSYMITKEYLDLYNTYETNFNANKDEEKAQQAVCDAYWGDKKESFLWVKSIWSVDAPWEKPIKNKKGFLKAAGAFGNPNSNKYGSFDINEIDNAFAKYDTVMKKAINDPRNKTNGLLFLGLIAGAMMFLSQRITMKQQEKSMMITEQNKTMGIMMKYLMPIVYISMALFSSAAFTIYLTVNSMIGIAFTLAINGIFKLIDKRNAKNKLTKIKKYGRPDPNAKK